MHYLFLWLFSTLLTVSDDIPEELLAFSTNKQIPEKIEREVLTALSHFPELKETEIHFVFQEDLKGPIMAARPVVGSLFRRRENRVYHILINPMFKLKHLEEPIEHIPDSVMIGWIGHELGHIMDYENRNTWGIMRFGIGYWLSAKYVRKAERVADTFAIEKGLGDYLVKNKEFILGHANLPKSYKDRIARLYLSPDDIMELIAELENEAPDEQEETLGEEETLQRKIQERASEN